MFIFFFYFVLFFRFRDTEQLILYMYINTRYDLTIEPVHEISNNVLCATNKGSDQTAHAYAQSDQSLCSSFEYSMSVKLLTEQHLEILRLKEGYATLLEITWHGSISFT